VGLMNFISAALHLTSVSINVQILRPDKSEGVLKILYTSNEDESVLNLVSKPLSEIQKFIRIYLFSNLGPFPIFVTFYIPYM